jgi:hypothetical protein
MEKKEKLICNKMPDTVRVLGKVFKIEAFKDGECEDADGMTRVDEQIINVREKPAIAYCQDTLLHETIHAIDETLFLKMTERQVSNLASVLLAVLKDNPEFTKWLLIPE